MTQELMAYLMHQDGKVYSLPTEGLRLALEHLVQGSRAQEAGISCGNAAVYEFLQVLKWEMRAATSSSSGSGLSEKEMVDGED